MNLYGYNANAFTQPDELAKQIYAQQALSTSLPYQRSTPEPHAMPSPSGAPWNMQSMPWGTMTPPNVMQFNAQPSTSGLNMTPVIHSKRKSLDADIVVPAKQLITEEKMAAHLNGLHISSDYTNYGPSISNEDMMVETPSVSLNDKIKPSKIVLADEIKKLTNEPLLPPSLLERLEKPCMSLMVWKPKEDILDIKKKTEDNEKEEEPKKRNGLLVAENVNVMDVEM